VITEKYKAEIDKMYTGEEHENPSLVH
jgi:long-chain acyl-CoA synthetase